MLVRFHSEATGAVTMFGEVAVELLHLMGMSGSVPGAVLARDIPEALRRLTEAVESPAGERALSPARPESKRRKDPDDDDEERDAPKISLRVRAYPLLELLKAAAAEQCPVVWEEADKATG
jgi:hypothetical protein